MKKLLRIVLALLIAGAVAFAIFWYARPADVSFDQARASLPHAEDSHFADVDGVRLHYQEKGSGPAMVLLHGYTASTYTWKDVFAPLAARFHVIAVDFKGFGFSAKPDGDYTRRAQADLVVHLLDRLKLNQAILCGSSMGGEVSMNVAVHYPPRVSRVILVDSAGLKVSGGGSVAPRVTQWPFIGPALAALALTSDGLVRQGLQQTFYDQAKVTDERVAAYYRPLKTRDGQHAAFLARVQAEERPVEPEIGRIQQPTLIVWGAEDQLIPLAAGQRLNALIAGSRLVVFDKCGHVPQEEMPERFVREVISFAAPGAQAAETP